MPGSSFWLHCSFELWSDVLDIVASSLMWLVLTLRSLGPSAVFVCVVLGSGLFGSPVLQACVGGGRSRWLGLVVWVSCVTRVLLGSIRSCPIGEGSCPDVVGGSMRRSFSSPGVLVGELVGVPGGVGILM